MRLSLRASVRPVGTSFVVPLHVDEPVRTSLFTGDLAPLLAARAFSLDSAPPALPSAGSSRSGANLCSAILVALAVACNSSPSAATDTTAAAVASGQESVATHGATPTSPAILAESTHRGLEVLGPKLPIANGWGVLETVASIEGQMPTGIAVSNDARIFLSFPHWTDPIGFTVAELKDGRLTPYPDEAFNQSLTSVQSVYVDAKNHLWLLDSGNVNFGLVAPNAAKLIEFDLVANQVITTITFPQDVVAPRSYPNDVRIDLGRGNKGMAFITDSSSEGANSIVVVDLATKKSWRKLNDHTSVKADPAFLAFVESQPVYRDSSGGNSRKPLAGGVDGIALSSDAKRLFYCPLGSRHLYSVAVDALVDEHVPDTEVAKTIVDHGDKGASDGLETDDKNRVYATNYETNAIVRRNADGFLETVVADPRLLWPDTLSVSADGYLYVTANQLHRQAMFHGGLDQREKPYAIFRVKIDGQKVR